MKTLEQIYEDAFYDKDYDFKHGILNMKQRVVKLMKLAQEQAIDLCAEKAKFKMVDYGSYGIPELSPQVDKQSILNVKELLK